MTGTAFGVGAYSLPEAGHLLGIPPSTIRHWVFGYGYARGDAKTRQPPLWQPQYGPEQDQPLLGFRDLLEARIVRGLRREGMGLPTIRKCLELAREVVGDDHPFSTTSFRTDGKTLFIDKGGGVLDLKTRQHVFRRVIAPTFRDLDFDADAASRWWLGSARTLVVDPARSWGQPIVAQSGVATARLLQAVEAEGSIERVARQFDLPRATVREALAFERRTLH